MRNGTHRLVRLLPPRVSLLLGAVGLALSILARERERGRG